MKRFLLAAFALLLVGAAAAPPMKLPPQPKVRPAGIPANYVMVSPCIRGMGEHWANLKNLNDPIYGTYRGKVIFTESMIPLSVLEKGYVAPNMRALPGHTIDHVGIDFYPHGHEGMPIPHYDVHAYYISYADEQKICPNGVPDPGMKTMNGK